MEETETMKRFSVLFAISLALICIPCITSAQGNAAPTFTDGDSTTRSVAENTAAGETIGSAVAATDTDTGDTLTYTLGGTDASSFDIVSTSGQLQTKDALDYETGNSYEVTVSVSDSTDTDTITVTINVTNVNEAPTFPDTTNTTLEVTNHTPVGTNIDPAVSATDPDVTATNTDVNPDNAIVDALTYTLGGTDASSFEIDAETGQLRTVEGVAFDRTIQSSYSVTVTASDGEFSVEISVGITVVLTPPNERTPQVQDAIVDALPHRSSIDDVTLDDLRLITHIRMWDLYVPDMVDLTALQAGDFDGFTEVTNIRIHGANLTTLPEGLFSGLTKLQYLNLGHVGPLSTAISLIGNQLSELPADIFDGLTALEELHLGDNNLGENDLPADIFDGLTALKQIWLNNNELTTLPEGLFSGLTLNRLHLQENDLGEGGLPEGLFDGATVGSINLWHNDLSELPEGIFDGLTTLWNLSLGNNDLSVLPAGIFDELTALGSLGLGSNDLSELPEGIFDKLTALWELGLQHNELSELPADIFDELTALTGLGLASNDLSVLPAGIFDGLTKLEELYLDGNVFSTLPEGIFGGLTALTILDLESDLVSSFRVPVSIEEVSGGAFKATAPTGAPFPIVLSLTVTKGTLSETTVTIPTGALESDAFVVVPTPGETIAAVNVDIDEPLPSIPSTHNGYNLVYKDIRAPNVSIMVPTGVQNGEFEVTVVFNEEVRFFEQIGLFMKGTSEPSIAEWNPQEGGTDYKATITTVRSGTAIFEVAASRAADFSHNLNTAAEQKTVNILIGPTFSDGDSTTRAVNENTAAGENIGTPVAATDPDSDDILTYTLGGTDASSFDIDAETGQLQTKAELDYETDDSYTVTVSVSDGNSGTDAIDVTIEVTNVNEAPKFATTTATRSIAENTAAGIDIGEPVAATDPDVAGTNTDVNPDDATVDALTYTLGGTDTASFAIDSDTGQLETKVALDYETKDSYEVTVTASDGGTDTASITVTINITDVNEDVPNSAPTFTAGDSTTRSVAENTAAGEDIGSAVAATDTDIGDTLTYTLSGTDASSFAIVSTSGQLQTKDALDYETDNSYEVTVSVSDSIDTDTITVTISVTNVNEAPAFATTTTTRSIAENTAASTDIGTAVSATDPDVAGTNTDVNPDDPNVDALTYTLGGTDAASFDIVSTSGQLQTKLALDYETDNSYSVTVTVSDGGTDTASITVTINITNVNEAPKFATTTATRSIAENTAVGTAIGEPVAATDPDGTTDVNPEDDNVDALTYTLGGTDAASFVIDSETGQLKTKVALDYETKDSYEVTVTVSDGGTDTASITVVINITTAPTFTDGASTTRSVAENTAAGEAIGSAVAATDADSGNTLTYTLGGDPDAASFTIVSTSGQLQTKDALDYETKDSYEVTVTASDDNDSTDAITVTINVTNVNEAPTFPGTGTTATRSIAENTGTGENIGAAVSATDPDGTTDVNPTDATVDALTYTLGGTDAALFAIDADTGQLQTVAGVVFDRTIQSSYSVTVTASDGEFMVTISVDITVVVTPVCDRTPQIRAAIIAAVPGVTDCADVTETHLAAIPTLNVSSQGITTLKAGDFDGLTTLITLNLNANRLSTLPAGVFDELTALTTLNLRHNQMMTLPADVFDELTALTNLNLNRNQISELRAEVFDKLTALTVLYLDNNQMMTLREDVFDKLTALTTLSLNANQLSELPAGVFDELTALTTLFLNHNQMMTLREDVFDKLTVLTTLFLNNNLLSELPADVFDKLTALTSLSLGANLLSELPADVFDKLTALTALSLSDNLLSALPAEVFKGLTALTELYLSENTVDPLPVTVSLKKGAEGAFKATAHTGAPFAIALPVTVTSGTLDGDATTITVPIGDVESDPLTVTRTAGTTAAVTVDIGTLPDLPSDHNGYALVKSADLPLEIFEDVSNAAPTFSAGDSTTLSVAENTAAGEDIGSAVAATDTDTGDTLTYTLGGTDASSFAIVSTSGQLQTKDALDYETDNSYEVTVSVSDGTDTDTITVTISVTNVNEAPKFATTTATRSIAENTAASTDIGAAVSATDPDGTTDVNPDDATVDALTYTLGGTDAASFDIDSETGQLETKVALDYETDNSYEVTVSVSDGTDTDTITVTISVTNVNEAPKFATTTATRSIAENTAASTNIGAVVSATDPDGTTDVNPDDDNVDALTYTLGGTDASSFAIVGTSGQLQTKLALDYETDNSYTVTVSVSDGTDTDSITVTINITNVNEAPKFATTTTTRSIAENAAVGTNIGAAVSATDPDGTTDVNPEDANVDALTYTLGGTDAASFNIVGTSGQLQTKVALDHETKPSYEVTVTASDGGTDTASITVTINILETTRPNVSITVPTGVQNGAFEVTVVFDEAVTGFAQSELVVTGTSGSSITTWNPQTGGTDYKATITPTQTGTAIFKVAASVAKDAAENQNTAAIQQTVQVDMTRPTVSITIPSGAQNGVFEVTVVFSEAVTGFAQSELVVTGTSGASITAWNPQTGGTDYKATITPTSGGTAIFNVAENVAEDTGGNQNTVATQQTVQVDMTSPTVSITIPSSVQNAPFDVTVVFSEAVTGFEQSELVVTGTSGSSITAWNPQDGGTDYKATITPTQTGTAIFNVAANVAADAATNQNTAATQQTVQVNLTRPTVSITIPSDAQNGAFEVTVVFSEAVTGFAQSELVVTGTSGASITTWSPQTGGTDYKATITPTSGGTAIFNVAENVAEDTGGNQNTVATQQTVQVDMTSPTVSLTIPSGVQNAPFDVTVVFSEAVTGFEQSELVVTGTSGSTITAWNPQDGGTDYKATITPTSSGTALFNVAANVAADAATNQNTAATQQTVQVNLTRPTVSITIPSDAQNGAFEVTVVFSEAVTGFAQSELVVSGTSGSSITTWSPQTGGTDYKATITPTSGGTAIFNVAANVAEDTGGNQNTVATQQTVQVDMTQPTVSITIPSSVQNAPFDVTVVFSEAVTDFIQSELAVSGTSGSSITAWSPQTGGTDYKATITPTQTGTAIFNVAANVAADAATNQNTAATEKTVQVDRTQPTVSITIPSEAQNGAFEVTVVFSEAVTGFAQSELVVSGTSGSSITTWSPQTGGTDYKATITPTSSGTAIFNVAANVAKDAVENQNTAAPQQTVQVDMTQPTVSLTIPSGVQNAPFDVTVVFSEAVTGFVQSDLAVSGTSGSSITAWNPQDGGTDYKATITPTSSGTAIFNVAANVAADAATNQNTAATQQTVQVNLTRPTVSITTPSDAQNGAFDVTVVFSEAVTGFEQSELVVTGTSGASITAWNPQTGGTDYKATITPTQTGTAIFNVAANVAEDTGSNGNTAASEQTVQVDRTRPTVSITIPSGAQNGAFEVTVVFDEAVTGFVQSELVVTGTSSASITAWNPQTGGTDYRATITPTQTGTAIFNVAASVAKDAAENQNIAATQQTVQVDMTLPAVSITTPSGAQNGAFDVTVVFSEAMTGFVQSELIVSGTSGASITAWNPQTGDTDYKAAITPTQTGTAIFNVSANVAEDAATNGNTAASEQTVQVVLVIPSAVRDDSLEPLMSVIKADGTLYDPDVDIFTSTDPDNDPVTFSVNIDFGEAVSGFVQADFTINQSGQTDDTLITNWVADVDGARYTAKIICKKKGGVSFWVDENVAQSVATDAWNTASARQVVSVFYDVGTQDDTHPFVTLTVPPVEEVQTETFIVTVSFNERVFDFTQSDLSIVPRFRQSAPLDEKPPGKVVSIEGWEPDADGMRYTATIALLEARPRESDGKIYDQFWVGFMVQEGVAQDAGGNPNGAVGEKLVTVTLPKESDKTSPTVKIVPPDDSPAGAFDAKICFSEVVIGFTESDLQVTGTAGATITDWKIQEDEEDEENVHVFIATLTPTQDGTVTLNVSANVAKDAAGNGNTEATQQSITVAGFDSRPTVRIIASEGVNLDPFQVTIEFSAAVTDFVQSELLCTGTAEMTVADWSGSGVSYTAMLTPKCGGTLRLDVAKGAANAGTVESPILSRAAPRVTVVILPEDVNHDGVVSILDLFDVAANFGKTVEDPTEINPDVNRDGIVDTTDFNLVKERLKLGTDTLEAANNAPAIGEMFTVLDRATLEKLDPTTLKAQLDRLRAKSDGSLKYLRAIALLESVLAALRPVETLLLANYPNPFNPETWIPYHLANASDVVITIYDMRGSVVRRLELGHQREGYYTSRSRAAYWDGRNHIGERVASDVYFYQLEADNRSLLRKMVILK